MRKTCEKCGAQMNYTEGPGHLWENTCVKCDFKEAGTFSPAIEPYVGNLYSVYLEPINSLDKKQLLKIKEYLNTTDNFLQIKNKYCNGQTHELLSQLQENVVDLIVKQFNDVGLGVKVVANEP